ncbi:MAG: glycosyltransferase family 2 protein [Candidatus Omnitrophota bacterium]
MAELSIIIVNWNSADVLRKCFASAYDTINIPFEIIVIDNNSSDNSVAMIRKEFAQAILIARSSNAGFSKANNDGFKASHGAYILVLNPDTVLLKGAVNRMVDFLKARADIGILGPRILKKDGIPDLTCKRKLPRISREFFTIFLLEKMLNKLKTAIPYTRKAFYRYYEKSEECESLSGSCMLFKRETFGRLGGFDESVPMYLDDIDICHRSRKMGLINFYLADAEIMHIGKYSTNTAGNNKIYDVLARQAHLFYYRKHSGKVVEFVYRIIIALSVPYLLTLDTVCAPYFIFKGRAGELAWIVRKHLKYLKVAFSKEVLDVIK